MNITEKLAHALRETLGLIHYAQTDDRAFHGDNREEWENEIEPQVIAALAEYDSTKKNPNQFEYLMLMLVRTGIKNPFATNGILYFKTEQKSYKLQSKDNGWILIDYTHQHNAPDIINGEQVFKEGDWRSVLACIS